MNCFITVFRLGGKAVTVNSAVTPGHINDAFTGYSDILCTFAGVDKGVVFIP